MSIHITHYTHNIVLTKKTVWKHFFVMKFSSAAPTNMKRPEINTLGEWYVASMFTLWILLYHLLFLNSMIPGRRGGGMMESHEYIPSWRITWFMGTLCRWVSIIFFVFASHPFVFTQISWKKSFTKKTSSVHHISLLTFQLRWKPRPRWNIRGIRQKRRQHSLAFRRTPQFWQISKLWWSRWSPQRMPFSVGS